MNVSEEGIETLTVLVVAKEESFASAVADGLEAAGASVITSPVPPAGGAVERGAHIEADALVVSDGVDAPAIMDRLGVGAEFPAVLLADADSEGTIAAAVERGASDVFPRTAATSQCALVADRLASIANRGVDPESSLPSGGGSPDVAPVTGDRAYRAVFENVSDGVVIHDPETGEIVDVNKRYCEINGYERKELVGEDIGMVTVPSEEYGQEAAQGMIEQAREEGPQLFEWRNQHESGETFPVEVHLAVVELDGVERVLASVRDITERKRHERELRASERRLRLIAEHIDEVIYLSTADLSEILYINPAYEDIYGRPVEELKANPQDIIEATHPNDRERYEADVAELIADVEARDTRDVYDGEYRVVVDDEVRWVRVARFPVENDEGSVDRIVGRARDITERKRREREFEQIFNGVTDAIAIQDPETAELLDANQTFVERLDYESIETAREQGVEGLSAADAGFSRQRAQELCHRVIETGESETVEWVQETKAGDRILIEATVSPAVIGGEERIVSIQRDITDHRQLERRFRRIAERVEEVIYLADADLTEVRYVNDAFADIYGRPVEELSEGTQAFMEAVHPEDRDDYAAELEAMVADIRAGDPDDNYEFAFRIKRPDGETRWLEATGYPIQGAVHEPDQFVGVVKDVTERHQREQTLETFHEATSELTAADSRISACRQAVRAAETVLGFPLVSTYLYEEETGRLEPTAVTDRLAELDVEPSSFGPGESLPWQVYVEGEAVTSSELPADVYGPEVPNPEFVLPLGPHGVMLVGAPSATFDAEDVELVQILVATLEAALNHVAGKRALDEREAELQRQQERANRLEELNTIIRDIDHATVEQSSRASIEDAVCERLIDVDRFDLVWIAEESIKGNELRPRTSAGGSEGYVAGLTSVVDSSGAGGHPAVAAAQTNEPRTVENVATEATAGSWRKHALRHGIQSVVAVPVRYETTTHGVLSVASSDPGAFDEATRDVLAELGRSIGYAITVTERERALESEGTTELEFEIADEGLFMFRAATMADCRVRLERTIRRTGGSFSMFYAINGAPVEEVVGLATAAPEIEAAQVVNTDEGTDDSLIEVTAPTWFGDVFTEHGAVVRGATIDGNTGRLVVEAPRGSDVRTLVEGFQNEYPETEFVAQRQRERTIRSLFKLQDALREELTDRQWESLETAYSAGYFEWPREVSGEEVAALIGVSQPTFNKHLRVAERSAFRLLLDHEYPDGDD